MCCFETPGSRGSIVLEGGGFAERSLDSEWGKLEALGHGIHFTASQVEDLVTTLNEALMCWRSLSRSTYCPGSTTFHLSSSVGFEERLAGHWNHECLLHAVMGGG